MPVVPDYIMVNGSRCSTHVLLEMLAAFLFEALYVDYNEDLGGTKSSWAPPRLHIRISVKYGSGEMTQWLRTLAALLELLSWIPSSHKHL